MGQAKLRPDLADLLGVMTVAKTAAASASARIEAAASLPPPIWVIRGGQRLDTNRNHGGGDAGHGGQLNAQDGAHCSGQSRAK